MCGPCLQREGWGRAALHAKEGTRHRARQWHPLTGMRKWSRPQKPPSAVQTTAASCGRRGGGAARGGVSLTSLPVYPSKRHCGDKPDVLEPCSPVPVIIAHSDKYVERSAAYLKHMCRRRHRNAPGEAGEKSSQHNSASGRRSKCRQCRLLCGAGRLSTTSRRQQTTPCPQPLALYPPLVVAHGPQGLSVEVGHTLVVAQQPLLRAVIDNWDALVGWGWGRGGEKGVTCVSLP